MIQESVSRSQGSETPLAEFGSDDADGLERLSVQGVASDQENQDIDSMDDDYNWFPETSSPPAVLKPESSEIAPSCVGNSSAGVEIVVPECASQQGQRLDSENNEVIPESTGAVAAQTMEVSILPPPGMSEFQKTCCVPSIVGDSSSSRGVVVERPGSQQTEVGAQESQSEKEMSSSAF